MKKIRILEILLDTEIFGYQISAFRGAIANKVGTDNILFHNHTLEGFRHSYPLIQYKRINKKATIICIEQGVDEIYHLFNNSNWELNLNGEVYKMKIDKLYVNSFNLNVWDKFFHYRIFNWMSLNPENHKKYLATDSLTERIEILESILVANILSFAKGINWQLEEDKKIELKITNILDEKLTKYKDTSRVTFGVEFKTNVFIPQHIGLGKATSHGYGAVYVAKK